MRVLHIDDSMGWRGGQRQVELLLDENSALITPEGSRLQARVSVPTHAFGIRGLHRALRLHRPELVAAHGSRAHDLALLQFQVPIVVHRRVDFRRRSLKYRAVDGFVAVSRAVRDVLIEAGVAPGRIVVVPDAVAPEPGRALPRPEGLLVLAAGASAAHKDHQTLIDAMRGVEGTLWIAGSDGPDERWLGWRDDLPDLLQTADVFVHSSIEEGFGSVLLEARASGIPIVSTRAGGAPEAAGPGAILVPPSDPGAMRAAILTASTRRRSPEDLTEFHPDAVRSATIRAYRQLIAV